jgi:hypothetical protein
MKKMAFDITSYKTRRDALLRQTSAAIAVLLSGAGLSSAFRRDTLEPMRRFSRGLQEADDSVDQPGFPGAIASAYLDELAALIERAQPEVDRVTQEAAKNRKGEEAKAFAKFLANGGAALSKDSVGAIRAKALGHGLGHARNLFPDLTKSSNSDDARPKPYAWDPQLRRFVIG